MKRLLVGLAVTAAAAAPVAGVASAAPTNAKNAPPYAALFERPELHGVGQRQWQVHTGRDGPGRRARALHADSQHC